jgi:hypothetical protein
MTRNHARKKAIRARMAASGEPYSVAARNLSSAEHPDDAAAREIVDRASRTLAAPSARIEFRVDWNWPRRSAQDAGERLLVRDTLGRLAGHVVGAVRDRVAGLELGHTVSEGFVEPAAGRYMIASGRYAEIYLDGRRFGGRPGRPVRTLHGYPRSGWEPSRQERPGQDWSGEVLWLLRLLSRTCAADPAGHERVRGTPCRKLAARVDPGELTVSTDGDLTVWIDGEHVRRIQLKRRRTLPGSADESGFGVFREVTLELWDFGVSVSELDWSRLPSFRTPG